jgi:hypothetical protein
VAPDASAGDALLVGGLRAARGRAYTWVMRRDDCTQLLSIREARAYLRARHGIVISRATFWRHFLPPGRHGIEHWRGALVARRPNVAYAFAVTDVDRMAAAYAAYRQGAPAWYDVRADLPAASSPAITSPRGRLPAGLRQS